MMKETFYEECGKMLGTTHDFVVPYSTANHPTRWNNRAPGNGRFPGFGTIRMFSPNYIHVCLSNPRSVNVFMKSTDETLEFLRQIMAE